MKRYRSLLFSVLALAVVDQAQAISCPGNGAKMKVIINNPTMTTGQTGTVRGDVITGQQTCLGQAISYMEGFTLNQLGDNEVIVPLSGGVNSGMWKHQISMGTQVQFQQTPVLFTSNPNQYATVRWTHHPVVIQVNQAGDAGPGGCILGNPCTFRDALTTANALLPLIPDAILIQFNLSPGTMTQSADLVIGSSSYSNIITIDGTDSNGDPWIVGDALAAAQGNQDPFTRLVDLNNTTKLRVEGPNVTIKGLKIANTVLPGQYPSKTLVESIAGNTRIEAVQIDGGATNICTPSDCSTATRHLISLGGSGSVIQNVEGRSAYGQGVNLNVSSSVPFHQLRDSWFHHNYTANVAADESVISRNMIELGGRRLGDDQIVFNFANGITPIEAGDIETNRNVVRNHSQWGVQASATSLEPLLFDDYVCGNSAEGIRVTGTGRISGSGLATVYNANHGVNFTGVVFPNEVSFDNDNAFASNSSCGLKNSSVSGVAISADNNQWRGATSSCTQSADRCATGGPITCATIQDFKNASIVIDAPPTGPPTFPSNVILRGQAIRVQGAGFNAIDGNPENTAPAASCSLGNGISSTNCCRKKDKANQCVPGSSPPAPPSGGSNCVALLNGANRWKTLPVTSVTPTTIVTEITDGVFVCVGGSSEVVRVVKQGTTMQLVGTGNYCLNTAPL